MSLDEFGDCLHEHAKPSGEAGSLAWWCPECGALNNDPLPDTNPNPESWKVPTYFERLVDFEGDRDMAIQLEIKSRGDRARLAAVLRKIVEIMGPHYDADDKYGPDEWSISLDAVAPLVALLGLGKDIPLPNNFHWNELIDRATKIYAEIAEEYK